MRILFFALFVIMHATFAQDNSDMLPRLEERVERLKLTCSAMNKCQAGYTVGMGPEEALKNCVSSGWGNRQSCLESLKCENSQVVKCRAGYTIGLNPDEGITNCVSSGWGHRQSCIESVNCTEV